MKILITGAQGFIAKNLIAQLRNKGLNDILAYSRSDDKDVLEQYASACDFVFHLAGVNRPENEEGYFTGNVGFTAELLQYLKRSGRHVPVLFSSSVQAAMDTAYGRSKKACESLLFAYGKENNAKTYVYRLPNVFGKWCRPNYNSAIATFCCNIANGADIAVEDRSRVMQLAYIDDVLNEFIAAAGNRENRRKDGFCIVEPVYEITLGEVADKLAAFKASRDTLVMPSLTADFDRKLYATLISYLPEDGLDYCLDMKTDHRGWLAEFIKSENAGQIFISETKPGITRGNHWHCTKTEKFIVIKGEAVVSLRKLGGNRIIKYMVSGDTLRVIDIPAGYVHSITNTGSDDLITLFWSDEIFDSEKPDTYSQTV